MENKAYSKVGEDINQFKLNGLVRFSFKSLTTNKAKKPFISFLLTQYRMAGKVGEQKEFSKTFQVLVFDDKLVDMLRVIDQQVRVEVFGNIGIKVEQVGARRVSTPTLIATSVNVVEHLGIAFQETGKPQPSKVFTPKPQSSLDKEIAKLEETDDLPF